MPSSLSKTNFMSGLQCSKRLWLQVKDPSKQPKLTKSQQRIIHQGVEVGLYARKQFPNGLLICSEGAEAIQQTQQALQSGTPCLFEAAFLFDDIFIRCDILQRTATGTWDLIEVKSSGKVKDEHIQDLAIQKYVLLGHGLKIDKTQLMHINTKSCFYPDLSNLFTIEDITPQVEQLLSTIPNQVEKFRQILATDEPHILIGKYCKSPNPCPFQSHCWQQVPEVSIFTIPRLSEQKLSGLLKQNIFSLFDLPENFQLTDNQRIYVDSVLNNQPHIDHQAIHTALSNLEYPLHFFDVETHNPAIPRFDNLKPYEQFLFQYSCHILHTDGSLTHHEYLHTDPSDPRMSIAQALATHIGSTGSVIVYHLSFESSRLKKLAEDLPEHTAHLESIVARLWDQEEIFKKHYRHPAFHGSTSIKKVLPVLVPTLSYNDLAVKRGDEAQTIWDAILITADGQARNQMITDLKAYCQLDTLAMVEIHRKLLQLSR
jgi:Domain of unknown function(DUF2779)